MPKLLTKLPYVVFLGILIYGIIARAHLIAATNLWYDEAFSGILVKENFGRMLEIIAQDRVHPPLYYFLLKIWTGVFGNSDLTLRSFSLVFGIALIIVSFVLIKKLINTKVALVASAIFAFSPLFILYSVETRSYMMLTVEVLVSIALFINIYRQPINSLKQILTNKRAWWLAGVCLLMLVTHYLSVGIIAAFIALFATRIWPVLGKIMWTTLAVITIVVIGRGLMNGGNYNIYPKELTHTHWLNEATPANGGELLYAFIFGVDTQAIAKQEVYNMFGVDDANLIYLFTIILLIVVIPAIYLVFKGKDHAKIVSKLLLLCLAGVLIISLLGVNVLLPRYVMFIGVVFVLWIASLFEHFRCRYLMVAGLSYLFMLSQVQWSNSSRQFDLPAIREAIVTKRVVTESPFDFLVLKYYLNDNDNLYFLDNDHFHMSENYWPYFDVEEVIEEALPTDYVL